MSSKTFFKKLKQTCQKIDSDVNEIKNKITADHETDEEVFAKRICDFQDRLRKLKSDANDLKSTLEPQLSHTRDFIRNFKELIAETEISISKKEDYLKQYGYKPLEVMPQNSLHPDNTDVSPIKNVYENAPSTPSLIDYGIASYYDDSSTTMEPKASKSSIEDLVIPPDLELKNPVKSNGNSGSTPVLDVQSSPNMKPEETPPLPESVSNNNVAAFPSTPTLIL